MTDRLEVIGSYLEINRKVARPEWIIGNRSLQKEREREVNRLRAGQNQLEKDIDEDKIHID